MKHYNKMSENTNNEYKQTEESNLRKYLNSLPPFDPIMTEKDKEDIDNANRDIYKEFARYQRMERNRELEKNNEE